MRKITVVNQKVNCTNSCINRIKSKGQLLTIDSLPNKSEERETQVDEDKLIIVFNLKLLGDDSETVVKRIKYENARVCLLLSYENNDDLTKETILSNTSWLLINNRESNSLAEELNQVLDGGRALKPKVTQRVLKYISAIAMGTEKFDANQLTNREVELLNLLSLGLLNKEIADEMFISEYTVKNHIRNIFKKLNVNNRAEAIIKYMHKEKSIINL